MGGSSEAAYELVRQHNRHHDLSSDPSCPFCAFERSRKAAIMNRAVLQTRSGDYVATHVMPTWTDGNQPEVVLWGSRVFSFYDRTEGGTCVYRESFGYWLTPMTEVCETCSEMRTRCECTVRSG